MTMLRSFGWGGIVRVVGAVIVAVVAAIGSGAACRVSPVPEEVTPTVRPGPTASGVACGEVALSSSPIAATYPAGTLEQRQRNVSESAVGTDQLVPHLAAFAYFGDAGIAGPGSLAGWSEYRSGAATFVIMCLSDGSRLRAEMYQPFPAEQRPIWAVRSYQRS